MYSLHNIGQTSHLADISEPQVQTNDKKDP